MLVEEFSKIENEIGYFYQYYIVKDEKGYHAKKRVFFGAHEVPKVITRVLNYKPYKRLSSAINCIYDYYLSDIKEVETTTKNEVENLWFG